MFHNRALDPATAGVVDGGDGGGATQRHLENGINLHSVSLRKVLMSTWRRKFSKVLSLGILHRRYTRALTFENLCQGAKDH